MLSPTGGRRRGGRSIGFEMDDEDPNFDEYLADFQKKKKAQETEKMTELKLHEMERHAYEDCPRYECHICKVKLVDGNYMTGKELRKHLKYKCPDVRVVCTYCKKAFKRV